MMYVDRLGLKRMICTPQFIVTHKLNGLYGKFRETFLLLRSLMKDIINMSTSLVRLRNHKGGHFYEREASSQECTVSVLNCLYVLIPFRGVICARKSYPKVRNEISRVTGRSLLQHTPCL
jgi:hypothetical protein